MLKEKLNLLAEITSILFVVSVFGPYQILNKIFPWKENILRDFILLAIGALLFAPISIPLYLLNQIIHWIAQ